MSYDNASNPDALDFIVWAVCRFDPVGFVNASEQDLNRMAPIAPAPVPLVFKLLVWLSPRMRLIVSADHVDQSEMHVLLSAAQTLVILTRLC